MARDKVSSGIIRSYKKIIENRVNSIAEDISEIKSFANTITSTIESLDESWSTDGSRATKSNLLSKCEALETAINELSSLNDALQSIKNINCSMEPYEDLIMTKCPRH